MDQAFPLDKCPVAGTKIEMKVHYEEDATEQKGYDSMRYMISKIVASPRQLHPWTPQQPAWI
jgi:hypothetical protein